MNSSKHSVQVRLARNNTFISKGTNTPNDLFLCRQCQNGKGCKTNSEENGKSIIDEYIHSLRYINVCHTMINRLIQSRISVNPENLNMPDVPNFLNVLTYLAKDVEGLTELQDLVTLEDAMQKLDKPDATNLTRRKCTDKKTAPENRPHDHRTTGIPRRVKCAVPGSKGNQRPVPLLDEHFSRKNSEILMGSLTNRRSESNIDDLQEYSEIETLIQSNSDLDSYTRNALRASDTVNSPGSAGTSRASCPRNKARNVKSKTKRDLLMIQNYLKRWGIEMSGAENTPEEDRPAQNKEPIVPSERKYFHGPESDVDSVNIQNVTMRPKLQQSNIFVSNITPSRKVPENKMISTFSELATNAKQFENTFITNEKPVWQSVSSPFGPSDESDIEPDLDDDLLQHKLTKQPVSAPVVGANKSMHKNSKSSYKVTQKPNDSFLLPSRRRSITDIDSEHLLAVSDMDDCLAVKGIRSAAGRSFILPDQILSNIGILTQSGEVKPDQEVLLKELRSRLASDMQTALFRKPRNRKLESDDIVRLHSDNWVPDKAD